MLSPTYHLRSHCELIHIEYNISVRITYLLWTCYNRKYNLEQYGSTVDEMKSKVTVPQVGGDFRHFLDVFMNIAIIIK